MGNIYVLTTGRYSDYSVTGATTNKEIAEAYAKLHHCDIATYEDMQNTSIIREAEALVNQYTFYFDRSGKITDIRTEFVSSDKIEEEKYITQNECYMCSIKADEYDKAKKIACDRRAAYLARYFNI